MAIKSYDRIYIEDVSENMGAMLEYASRIINNPESLWLDFINSEVCKQIECGNPKYLAGCSGRDYINMVLHIRNPLIHVKNDVYKQLSYDMYYWAGWAIAHLQHETGYTFNYIEKYLPLKRVLELYNAMHEADISKFLDVAETYFPEEQSETNLKRIRTASGLSQNQLAEASGVDLRSIQMYEQKRNDINKSQSETLMKLAKSLGCKMEDLIEIRKNKSY